MDWIVAAQRIEALTHSVNLFENRTDLSHEKRKGTPERLLYAHRKNRKQLFASEEEKSQQKPTSQHSDLGLPASSYEKINFCCLSLPVCAILSWQPEQTNKQA